MPYYAQVAALEHARGSGNRISAPSCDMVDHQAAWRADRQIAGLESVLSPGPEGHQLPGLLTQILKHSSPAIRELAKLVAPTSSWSSSLLLPALERVGLDMTV